MADSSVLTAFAAHSGNVCLVGAGGKKSTMYALARAHGGRVLLSSTSHMYPYDTDVVDDFVTVADGADVRGPQPGARVVALGGPTDTARRVGGIAPSVIREYCRAHAFDLCVVKADGARARWIKCPGLHEPLIPDFADVVVPVVSARVIGRPLDDGVAHRPERLAALWAIAEGDRITTTHVARLLADSDGALKGVAGTEVVALINMADDPRLEARARDVAAQTFEFTSRVSRIVIAAMRVPKIIDVLERPGV